MGQVLHVNPSFLRQDHQLPSLAPIPSLASLSLLSLCSGKIECVMEVAPLGPCLGCCYNEIIRNITSKEISTARFSQETLGFPNGDLSSSNNFIHSGKCVATSGMTAATKFRPGNSPISPSSCWGQHCSQNMILLHHAPSLCKYPHSPVRLTSGKGGLSEVVL